EADARAQAAAAEALAAERGARLVALATELEAAAADPDLGSARRRMQNAQQEWKDVSANITIDQETATRAADAEATLVAREREVHDQNERRRREALTRLQQLAARVELLVSKPDATLKAADHALRDVRAALADIPPLPSKRDFDEISQRLKAAQAALTPK